MAIIEQARDILSTKSDGQGYVDALVNKFIVKPKNAEGVAGFVFDYEGETELSLEADITDHFAENNQVINDHIARKPARITLHGFVAELSLKKATGLTGFLESIQNRLTTVPAFLGKYTPGMVAKIQATITQTQRVVNTVNQSIARAQNLVAQFRKAIPGNTKQQQAYNTLAAAYGTGQLMTVSTPYAYFKQMVIERLRFTQPDETKQMSDIVITLKEMRFVEVATVTANSTTFGGRASAQRGPLTDKGKTAGKVVEESLVSKFAGKLGSLF